MGQDSLDDRGVVGIDPVGKFAFLGREEFWAAVRATGGEAETIAVQVLEIVFQSCVIDLPCVVHETL